MQKVIHTTHDHGSIEGYVSDQQEHMLNFLMNYMSENDALATVKMLTKEFDIKKFAIIHNVSVDEDFRNQGIGSNLITQFLDDAFIEETDVCLLMADKYESNEVNLVQWYECFDFEQIVDTRAGMLMCFNYN